MSDIFDKKFQFWEYKVSHGSLLLRSPKTNEQKHNIDIMFFGVEFISMPRHISNICIKIADEQEIKRIEEQINKKVSGNAKVYILNSSPCKHFIVAIAIKIDKNDSDIFHSPFQI